MFKFEVMVIIRHTMKVSSIFLEVKKVSRILFCFVDFNKESEDL